MESQEEYNKIVGRAEMLAAMNCLMHHLSDEAARDRWTDSAMPDKFDWHILEYEGSSARRADHMAEAEKMSDNEFACVVRAFVDEVRWSCFSNVFTNAFKDIPDEVH